MSTKAAPSSSVRYSPDVDNHELDAEPSSSVSVPEAARSCREPCSPPDLHAEPSSSVIAPQADESCPEPCSPPDQMDVDEEASLFLRGMP